MSGISWIAVDWGTSGLRAWAMSAQGTPLAEARSDQGMGALTPPDFEPALLHLITDWIVGPTDVIACGMVGARQGWIEAPYRPVPCAPLNGPLMRAPAADPRLRVWIAPGLSQATPPDVMRGEETQIAGFLAQYSNWDGVICLPGTHTKWAHLSAGEVVSFQSFMSGELFALLTQQSVLRHAMPADNSAWDEAGFAEGLSDAQSRPERLAAQLFSLRAAGLLTDQSAGTARARLSGLLIGAELSAARPYWLGQEVAILGDAGLSALYQAALSTQGVAPRLCPAKDMTLAGLTAARALLENAP